LKARNLTCIGAEKGMEGGKDDDWQLIDCDYYAVHLFTERT
jgi:ribosomal silencing factor RsfS